MPVGEVERIPLAGLDGVSRAHVAAGVVVALALALRRLVDELLRLGEASLLQVDVLEPFQAVVVRLRPLLRQRVRRFVRARGVVPHAELQEDVRRHVQRVRRVGGDLRVAARGAQSQRRVHRIVVGVDEVVQHAGMVGMCGEERLEDRRGADLLARIDFVASLRAED